MEAWHRYNVKNVLKNLNTKPCGLTEREAKKRLSRFGYNEIVEKKHTSWVGILLRQFTSFLVLILIAATIISLLIGETISATVILIIVILNGLFGFFQEYKAERTIESLKKLITPRAVVIRDGKKKTIDSRMIVPGDILVLEEGSIIQADSRIIESIELKTDESSLTGESTPVSKTIEPIKDLPIADRKNMVWMGTVVTYGHGMVVVTGTGMNTEMGKIAHMIQEAKEEPTPLQEKLKGFSKNLGTIIMVISILIIVIGILKSGPLAGQAITDKLIVTMAITGIALAVAAIPEGLPAVVTITLALGLRVLARKNALIRKLPAVEALGSTTIICSDKTGTLTKNEMTVKKIYCNNKIIKVTGRGYKTRGDFYYNDKEIDPKKDKTLLSLLKSATLCNNASLDNGVMGDPTEGALLVVAEKAGLKNLVLEGKYPRQREIPFTSERKMMTVINREGNKSLVHVKGAPETILKLCNRIEQNGKIKKLTNSERGGILKVNQELASQALRSLAVAYKENMGAPEKDLIFLGIISMMDPPREGVKEDIEVCKRAGIGVVMITGDHRDTALAISRELGISGENDIILTGKELDSISDHELEKITENVKVYARVNPSHKVRIVETLKRKGHIITMTGDGVNDAPALKGADIGISMGIKGTDVAKEASDMILEDDNFSTIVNAVREGRRIYNNIKNFIQYLLSSNMGEVLVIFLAILIGFSDPSDPTRIILPITAVQILWINLLTDGLPALALGTDPPPPNVMSLPPRDPNEKILSRETLTDIIFVGILISIATLTLFTLNLSQGALQATTVAFTSLVVFQMVRVYSVRSKHNLGAFSNKKLILAISISMTLQLMVIYTPLLQSFFATSALGIVEWLQIILFSFILLLIMYAKLLLSRRNRK